MKLYLNFPKKPSLENKLRYGYDGFFTFSLVTDSLLLCFIAKGQICIHSTLAKPADQSFFGS